MSALHMLRGDGPQTNCGNLSELWALQRLPSIIQFTTEAKSQRSEASEFPPQSPRARHPPFRDPPGQ
jgi:hypothetical protein